MIGDLSLRGVTHRYNPTSGVFGIDLDVQQGEAVCLLGPSGCGKTTLLRIIAGLLDPHAGRIAIAGDDVTAVPAHARDIGMVFQTWALFAHLSVLRNVEFGLAMRGLPRTERRERALAMLDLVGLAALASRRPRQLSGGQQQRVALARALAIRPRLLLLDEPLSSLDYNTRVELRRELRQLQQRLGLTAITVTHDYTEALALADRTVLMHDGRIVEQAETKALFDRPATEYAARFFGLHNVVNARAGDAGPGHLSITLGSSVFARIPRDPAQPSPPAGHPVLVCFDQWSPRFDDNTQPGAIPVAVQDCVAEHGSTRVTVQLPGDAGPVAVQLPGLQSITPGSAAFLRIDWQRSWLLQPTTIPVL
jgi:putative spermidine/putrescine transport system ATP-binding protein